VHVCAGNATDIFTFFERAGPAQVADVDSGVSYKPSEGKLAG
jgi:hypothetical protein